MELQTRMLKHLLQVSPLGSVAQEEREDIKRLSKAATEENALGGIYHTQVRFCRDLISILEDIA